MKVKLITILFSVLFLQGCTSADINKMLQSAPIGAPLTQSEVSGGLKEALIQGISKGADRASLTDGFNKNDMIRILLPEDIRRVENTLRQVGLGGEIDKAILNINRGAEAAAREAKPIFIDAIRQLTIQDAFTILNGGQDAATGYLRKSTEAQLIGLFQPRIQESLNKVGATKHYSELAQTYNSMPLVNRKIESDLNAYVTARAIDGLFLLIAEEERNIRTNPMERTTALMRRVFGSQK